MKKLIFIYDIDGTLIRGAMQNNGVIKALGMNPQEFWHKSNSYSVLHNSDATLTYLYSIKKSCEEKGIPLTRKFLFDQGKTVEYFPGVKEWFDKINAYAESKGIEIKHYAVSTGNKETIEGMEIAKYFDRIYGCEYLYNDKGEAEWLKVIVNYTIKTQYIARIRKDVLDNIYDDVSVNKKIDEDKLIPFKNMVYFGDGFTDIPAMRIITSNGGNAIGVYDSTDKIKAETSKQLLKDKRITYASRADYSENSEIFDICKKFIDKA